MIFLDTSFLIALEVESDQNHLRALKIGEKIISKKFGSLIISDYIFDETITATFKKTKDLKKAIIVGENLRNSVEIINLGQEILEEAWVIFKEQKETKFSFTNCTIIAAMRKNIIRNLATFDEDFDKIKDINVIH